MVIRLEHIRKKFRRLQALDDVNVKFESGQVISLVGPNGSGKTTLIKSILGMVHPDSGKVFVDDEWINGDPSYREKIGYMPQVGRYPDNMKIGQLFNMLLHLRKPIENRIDRDLIQQFELEKIFEKPMRTLSGGTRQKVSAAIAFLFDPAILILDEPTAGLDPLASEILKEKILEEKKKDKMVLISSHILSDLEELTSHIMYMQEGKMLFFKDIASLKEETGEIRLGKAVAGIMKGKEYNNSWISRMLNPRPTEKIY
ncbi:MAG TPA: ABC transporter ATP-binding protein [Chitinophagaceae bacterium]|nr:ABC transporter ATP-binding protein [Chitinophagaceae bacterium]